MGTQLVAKGVRDSSYGVLIKPDLLRQAVVPTFILANPALTTRARTFSSASLSPPTLFSLLLSYSSDLSAARFISLFLSPSFSLIYRHVHVLSVSLLLFSQDDVRQTPIRSVCPALKRYFCFAGTRDPGDVVLLKKLWERTSGVRHVAIKLLTPIETERRRKMYFSRDVMLKPPTEERKGLNVEVSSLSLHKYLFDCRKKNVLDRGI